MVGAIMNIFGQPCRDDIFLASAQYRTIANQSAPSPSLSFPRCWTEVSAERRGLRRLYSIATICGFQSRFDVKNQS
jgi:hypothetical protein